MAKHLAWSSARSKPRIYSKTWLFSQLLANFSRTREGGGSSVLARRKFTLRCCFETSSLLPSPSIRNRRWRELRYFSDETVKLREIIVQSCPPPPFSTLALGFFLLALRVCTYHPTIYTATTPCIRVQRNFLRAGRQEVITLNIHRLRKGEAGVSLIVPLTEIRPSRVISLPVSFAFDPRPMRFDFHSLRKGERERKRKAGGRGKEKKRRESIFRPKLSLPVYTYTQF